VHAGNFDILKKRKSRKRNIEATDLHPTPMFQNTTTIVNTYTYAELKHSMQPTSTYVDSALDGRWKGLLAAEYSEWYICALPTLLVHTHEKFENNNLAL